MLFGEPHNRTDGVGLLTLTQSYGAISDVDFFKVVVVVVVAAAAAAEKQFPIFAKKDLKAKMKWVF